MKVYLLESQLEGHSGKKGREEGEIPLSLQ